MLEALAAAILLGGINTIADVVSSELKLVARPIYVFARVVLICYCVGGLVGARARQLMMGMLGGVMIGCMVATVYYLLAPTLGWSALAAAWTLFWLGFSLLDTMLHGGSSFAGAVLQGLAAAVLSGGFFYGITNVWTPTRQTEMDLTLARVLVTWSAAFFPGFIVLFWRRL